MGEEARSYVVVAAAVRKEFELNQEPQKVIQDELSLNLRRKQSVYDFAVKAAKEYQETGFTMELKFILLPKAIEINEQTQSFIIVRALPSSHELNTV